MTLKPDISGADMSYTKKHWQQMAQHQTNSVPQQQLANISMVMYGWQTHLLFGQLRTGLEKEPVEGCVLVGEVRRGGGALEVQAADDDVEHCRHCCQLHAIKHSWQLRRDGVRIWLVGVHDYSVKTKRPDHIFFSCTFLSESHMRNKYIYKYKINNF